MPAVPRRPPVRRERLARAVLPERVRAAWESASWSERTASAAAPGVALLGVVLAWALHWQGVDMAAHLSRVNRFRQYGWLLWDSRWYGGHYVLPYSVRFPPLGAGLGRYSAAAVSAVARRGGSTSWCGGPPGASSSRSRSSTTIRSARAAMFPSAARAAAPPRSGTSGADDFGRPARLAAWARRIGREPGLPVVVVLAVVAGVATWIATRHGPGLSPDSVTYLSAARNLAAGHGYLDLTGQANTTFAPGYPAVLAAGHVIGVSLMNMARLVNAASFAAIVLLSWVLLRRHVTSPRLLLAATAAVALSPAVLNVTDEAWSEPLFCVVLLVFILVLEDAVAARPPSPRLVAIAGLIAGVAFLVRYAASALIIAGVVVLLLSRRPARWRTRWLEVGVFLLGAAPLPALWVLRNATSGAPFVLGPRVAVTSSLWDLVRLFLSGVKELLVPTTVTALWVVVMLPVAVVATIGAVTAIRSRARRQSPVGSRSVAPLLGFVGAYAVLVLVAGKVSGTSIDVRTIMPIYLPLLVVGAWLIEEARQRAPEVTRRWVRPRIGLAVAGACLLFYGIWFLQVSWADGTVARGYAAARVVHSPLAAAVRRLPAGALVVTNAPWSLYYGSDHQPIVPVPGPLTPAASLVPATVDVLTDASCTHAVWVAWFSKYPGRATPGSLPRLVGVPLLTVRDGVLYELRPHSPSCEATSASALRSRGSVGNRASR